MMCWLVMHYLYCRWQCIRLFEGRTGSDAAGPRAVPRAGLQSAEHRRGRGGGRRWVSELGGLLRVGHSF